MIDLKELYHELIIDHSRRPRNCSKLYQAQKTAEGYNPLCGDKVKLYLIMENDLIKDVAFEGTGCAISIASASLMTESIKGKSIIEAEKLFADFHLLVTGDESAQKNLGKLAVLGGVKEYPSRVKCATLAWHTLHSALHNEEEVVTTE